MGPFGEAAIELMEVIVSELMMPGTRELPDPLIDDIWEAVCSDRGVAELEQAFAVTFQGDDGWDSGTGVSNAIPSQWKEADYRNRFLQQPT